VHNRIKSIDQSMMDQRVCKLYKSEHEN